MDLRDLSTKANYDNTEEDKISRIAKKYKNFAYDALSELLKVPWVTHTNVLSLEPLNTGSSAVFDKLHNLLELIVSLLPAVKHKIKEEAKKGGQWISENFHLTNEPSLTSSSSYNYENNGNSMTANGKFSDKRDFILKFTLTYAQVLKEEGISEYYAPMLAAQDSLESSFGTALAANFNYGGIKGKGTVQYTNEYIKGKDGKKHKVKVLAEFKNFKDLHDFCKYKVRLLSNSRYHAFDGGDFFDRVSKGGYATSPTYKNQLYEQYKYIKKYLN